MFLTLLVTLYITNSNRDNNLVNKDKGCSEKRQWETDGEHIFCSNMWVAVKTAIFGSEMRMQTWRWTELLQVLEVTANGSHTGFKHLVKFATALLMCSCGSSSQIGLQSNFQLINRLGPRLELMVLFQHGASSMAPLGPVAPSRFSSKLDQVGRRELVHDDFALHRF